VGPSTTQIVAVFLQGMLKDPRSATAYFSARFSAHVLVKRRVISHTTRYATGVE